VELCICVGGPRSSPDAMVVVAADGRIVLVSRQAE
jgi:hypothetical protein